MSLSKTRKDDGQIEGCDDEEASEDDPTAREKHKFSSVENKISASRHKSGLLQTASTTRRVRKETTIQRAVRCSKESSTPYAAESKQISTDGVSIPEDSSNDTSLSAGSTEPCMGGSSKKRSNIGNHRRTTSQCSFSQKRDGPAITIQLSEEFDVETGSNTPAISLSTPDDFQDVDGASHNSSALSNNPNPGSNNSNLSSNNSNLGSNTTDVQPFSLPPYSQHECTKENLPSFLQIPLLVPARRRHSWICR